MRSKKEKTRSTHSLFSNVIFLFGVQWKYSRLSFVFLLLLIPITLGLSFCGIYLPKLVVYEVMSNAKINHMIMTVGSLGLVIAMLNIFSQLITTYNFALMTRFREAVSFLKIKKTLYTDYENIESSKCRYMMQRADEALWGTGNGAAVEQMSRGATELVTNILGYILFGAIISFASPWIAVVLTITPLINYYIIKTIQKIQYKSREDTTPLDRKLWYLANNSGSFDGAKDIRIYGMAEWFLSMYKSLVKERAKWDKMFALKYFMSNIIDAGIILLRDGFAYAVLIYFVIKGRITVDNFILYFAAVASFAGWIGGIAAKFNNINGISYNICDLRDYLDYPEKANRGKGCALPELNERPVEIELKNVCFRYDGAERETLSDVSIKIKAGEKIAIVGLNGAGKTTLVKCICGLYIPTSGSIFVNGYEICEYNIYDYFSMFSIAFQDMHFLPVSILDMVAGKAPGQADRQRVTECIRLAGLSGKIGELDKGIDSMINKQLNENGIDLSGGEKQKLILARAIYKDAPVLVLDEPTAALDPIAENDLYQKYNRLTKSKTSIYISHRLSSTRFCDRILFLENGKIIEEGTHNELMNRNGKYANMFSIQSHYYQSEDGGVGDELLKI